MRIVGSLFFASAAFAAIRLAVADTLVRQETSAAIRHAITLEPSIPSAAWELTLAELDPVHAQDELHRALAANPRSSQAWIGLGLLEESAGNYSLAEDSLQQAAHVDHQYLPAWTLTNFYFRRGKSAQFWGWADRAASLAYDDVRPLLQLCDQWEADPFRLLAHFRDARKLQPRYLDFLIGEQRLKAAQQIALRMADDRANDPLLIDLSDRQLRAGDAPAAIELWNLASGFPSLDPVSGRVLTNGHLDHAPLNLGFDWRLGESDGVSQHWRPSELVFTLSGSQPEACMLLAQTVYLAEARFRLHYDYRMPQPATGIRWALDNVESPLLPSSSEWSGGAFDIPRTQGIRNLQLFYRREPGTTRAEGRIEIRNLRLEPAS